MRLVDAKTAADTISRKHGIPLVDMVDTFAEIPTIGITTVGYSYECDKTYPGVGTSNYLCSVCGETQGTWRKGLTANQKYKFCPWCGARMEATSCDKT